MNKIDISVIEYIGRFEGGIMVLLGVMYDEEYFDATFFYTAQDMVFTPSDEMEAKVGLITEHPQYTEMLIQILKKVVPFREIWPELKDIDFAKYIKGQIEIYEENVPEILPDGVVRKIE